MRVETLRRYGFGPKHIMMFELVYKDISARVLINGHLGESLSIKRGFKQGDSPSCGLFNICIDPLIRNVIADRNIRMIRMITLRTREEVNMKAGGFADDVHVLCGADDESVKGIFRQYERLTRKSGLELNADKTEILSMHTDVPRVYDVQYCGANIALATINEIKICGIWFCYDQERSYKLNVIDKMEKLASNLKRWKNRNLTFEGKSLIIKTFGMSQLIYNLQVVEIREL